MYSKHVSDHTPARHTDWWGVLNEEKLLFFPPHFTKDCEAARSLTYHFSCENISTTPWHNLVIPRKAQITFDRNPTLPFQGLTHVAFVPSPPITHIMTLGSKSGPGTWKALYGWHPEDTWRWHLLCKKEHVVKRTTAEQAELFALKRVPVQGLWRMQSFSASSNFTMCSIYRNGSG